MDGVALTVAIHTFSNVDVTVCGMCTCDWHKRECVPEKRCEKLFGDGGTNGEIATLKRLMGKDFPKNWRVDYWKLSQADYNALKDKVLEFEKAAYKACKRIRLTLWCITKIEMSIPIPGEGTDVAIAGECKTLYTVRALL